MHQPFDYNEHLREHIRKLGHLANAVGAYRISPDELEERLAMLRWEQEKFMRFREQTRKRHKLDFKCQCSRCTRMYTITHDDKKFLKDLGIRWGNSKTEQVKPSDD